MSIDIKYRSDPNSINLKKKWVVTVAILTTLDFDATTVDWTTVLFEGASPVHDLSDAKIVENHQKDVDKDGDIDYVFHFLLEDTDIQAGDTEAILLGETLRGTPIWGIDSIRTVPQAK